MKLGIVSDEIARDFAAAVRVGVPLGLRRYEIRNLAAGRAPDVRRRGDAGSGTDRARARRGDHGALAGAVQEYAAMPAAFRREMDEVYPRAAEWAHRWKLPGADRLRIPQAGRHRGHRAGIFERQSAGSRWWSGWPRPANGRARDGLTLMIEPEPICWCDSGRATAALIARAGSPALKINYDPGNVAWLENRDPLDEFDAVAPLIANVHIKDLRPLTRGAGFPEWVPAGEGMIDYAAHFRALHEIGYEGPVSLEPHMDCSAEATRRCKEAVERVS